MSVTTSITVSGTITGLTEGSNTLSWSYTNSASPGSRIVIRAAVTAVGIKASLPGAAWPTGALYVVIVPSNPLSTPTKLYLSASTTGANGATVSISQPVILPLISAFTGDIFLGTDAGTLDCEVYVL